MRKKILILLMSVAMLVTLMPIMAYAGEGITWEEGKVAQLSDGTNTTQYETIKEALKAHAGGAAGDYVLTIKDSATTYEVGDLLIEEYGDKPLIIKSEAKSGVTLKYKSDGTHNSKAIFNISGRSSGTGSVQFDGIKFDLTGGKYLAVRTMGGGSGEYDKFFTDVIGRYARNISFKNCTFDGDNTAGSSVLNADAGTQPGHFLFEDCIAKNVDNFFSGYGYQTSGGTTDEYGIKVKNCTVTNVNRFINNQGSDSTTIVEGCTVSSYNDYSIRTQKNNGGNTVVVKDSIITNTCAPEKATVGGIIVCRNSADTVEVTNSVLTMPKGFYHIYTAGKTATIKSGSYRVETLGSTDYIGKLSADRILKSTDAGFNFVSVAKIGNTKYSTLKDAVDAAETGDIIVMIADEVLTEEVSVPKGKSITLDLNGNTISNAATGFEFTTTESSNGAIPARFNIIVEGNMTICDSSEAETGKIEVKNYDYGTNKAILVKGNGSVTVNSGSVYGDYAAFYVVGYTGMTPEKTTVIPSLTVNGGTLSATKACAVGIKGKTATFTLNDGVLSGGSYGLCTNGTRDWYDGGNCQMYIRGGRIIATNGVGIYNPAESILEITGGVIEGTTAVGIKGGKTIINGNAVLKATGTANSPDAANSGITETGDALYIEDTYDNHTPVVIVSGGKLSSAKRHATCYYTNKSSDKGSLTVKAGLFSDKPADEVIATGCAAAEITDTTYHYIVGMGAVSTSKALTAGKFNINPTAYVAEGYKVEPSGNTQYPYEVKAIPQGEKEQQKIVVEQTTETSINEAITEKDEIKAAEKAAESADVTGVADALTEKGKDTIIQAAIDSTKNDVTAKKVEDAKQVDIAITVKAEVTISKTIETVTKEEKVIQFELEPVAVVTATAPDGTQVKSEEIPVDNAYLAENNIKKITVVLGCDFEPEQVLHIREDKNVEKFSKAKAASYENRTFVYDDDADTVTLEITQFSEIKMLAKAEKTIVSFDKNGGTGEMADVSVEPGAYNLPKNAFTAPENKKFAGWKINNAGDTLVAGHTVTLADNIKLYAQWETAIVQVSFDANGGTGTMTAVKAPLGDYNLPDNEFTAPAGKKFAGWTLGAKQYIEGDTITLTEGITLVASWVDIPVTDATITFKANGGTGTMDAVVVPFGKYNLPRNKFTAPAGKEFAGWKLGDKTYEAGDAITIEADVELTAQWKDIPVTTATITFDANGGSGTMDAITLKFGYFNLPKNGFKAPVGKAFDCWKIGDTTYTPGDRVTISADTKIVAQWVFVTPAPAPVVEEKEPYLVAQAEAIGKTTLNVTWNECEGASKYIVYANKCNTKGKKNAMLKLKTTARTSYTIKKISGKKLSKNTYYKIRVAAVDANGNVIKKSVIMHAITGNYKGKYGNATDITANAESATVKVGETCEVGATIKTYKNKAVTGHTDELRFLSSNTKVATVSADGVVTGVKAGTCKIYIQAANGMWAVTKISVGNSSGAIYG